MFSLHEGPATRVASANGKKADTVIALRKVTKSYPLGKTGEVVAVRGIDLEVARGEFVVITGRSGSGKTTVLNLAAGLTRPSSGEVLVDGVNVWAMPDKERSLVRNRTMGFVFQFPSLLPSLTVLENVVLPTMFGPSENRQGTHERALSLLAELGIAEKRDHYPRQLSAGQQKRAVIARSLMNRPEVLLADEPTGDLDEQTEKGFMELLGEIRGSGGVTILMVTHNRDLIRYGTRAVEMASGEIVA